VEARPLSACRTSCPPIDRLRRVRVALVVTTAVVAVTVSGCSSSASTTPSAPGESGPSSAFTDFAGAIGKPANPALCNGKQYTFGYDTFSDTDVFAVAVYDGLQKYASSLGCVTIKKLVDNADAATAVQNANIFVQQHVDGAILFNVVQAASQGQAQVLKAAQIPIVSLAVPVTGSPFITNDDSANGNSGGVALGEAFVAKKTSAPAYAIIGRYDGQDSTKQRMDGTMAGLTKTVPDVHFLPIETKADPPTAQSQTSSSSDEKALRAGPFLCFISSGMR
jgi:ABC-type sugar transport system substrate-binding protein